MVVSAPGIHEFRLSAAQQRRRAALDRAVKALRAAVTESHPWTPAAYRVRTHGARSNDTRPTAAAWPRRELGDPTTFGDPNVAFGDDCAVLPADAEERNPVQF